MEDGVNWFDQNPQPEPSDPPPPKGEGDYGENVVTLTPKGKRGQAGWKSEWHLAESGSPLPTLFNAMVALRSHPTLAKLVRYDEMARAAIVVAQIPGTPHDGSIPRQIKDADVIAIQEELQQTGLRRIAKATVQDAVQLRAEQDRYHPVRDYLDGLVWDGENRVYGWLGRYLGVEGNAYSDTIGRLFLVALAARMFKPGCKADYMLILEGPQGALKSSACRTLAGEWFSDNLPDLSRGDAVRLSMHLRGKWLIEIGEMSSFNAAESHTLKEFLTQTEERYTPKYGRNEVHEARQCLFIGTTNEGAYLKDATGGRRFWPVQVGVIDLDALTRDRDQLLAEAVALYRAGEKWWPDREFEAVHIAPEQAARQVEDPWEETIKTWIEGGPVFDSHGIPVRTEYGEAVTRPKINSGTVNDFLRGAIGMDADRFGTRDVRRVSDILKALGWVRNLKNARKPFERPGQQGLV